MSIEEIEKEKESKRKVDRRLIYILPSILALALSVTCFAYQFGNQIIDLKNTCYTIYVSVPGDMAKEECINIIEENANKYKISGYTILKNTKGGYLNEDGKLVEDNSFQISLMNVSKNEAYGIAKELKCSFGNRPVMVEESVVKVNYL